MIVDCAVYEKGRRSAEALELRDAYEAGTAQDDRFVWIGLHEPTPDEFNSVAREFDLHELAVEDAIKAHQRPKLEVYGDTLFLVLKTASYDDRTETVSIGQIMVFAGQGFVITVRHGDASELHTLRRESERRPELLRCGAGAVLYAVVDKVVDEYSPVIAGVEDDIEEVEEEVFSADRGNPTARIYKLQREVIELHRATAPLRDPLQRLASGAFPQIDSNLLDYLRDVHDHVVRADEQVEGFRDMLHGVLQANLAQVSVRQNEDMRKISAWVAIVAVPTMIAGIYGMNFEHMPELEWSFGYPLALGAMLTACVSLYFYFKRSGWL
ncbi:MAG TPA: magnesium/cobalt transporter CorA [Thermoleophilaceae bacterium]